MSTKTFSPATLIRFFAVLAGLGLLIGCGGGSSSTPPAGSPAVTLSPTTGLTFSTGIGVASAPQTVTVTNSGTAALTFSQISTSNTVFSETNTCGTGLSAGSACTISVVFTPTALDPPSSPATGTLTIADNASDSPQTVSLSGTSVSISVSPTSLTFTGVALGTTSAAQTVTFSNGGSTALTLGTPTITGDFAISSNGCGASVAGNGTCTFGVTFTPEGSGPWTGTLTIPYTPAGSSLVNLTVSLSGTTTVTNTVPVTVSFGPNGQGSVTATSSPYFNGIFTTVTICQPNTSTCVQVPNVLVDTGSVGLRVLSSALTGVNLTQLNDGSGDNLNECTEYGDGSFNWGPVALATVQIGSETASQVPSAAGGTANSGIPIQIISADAVPLAVQQVGQCVVPNSGPSPDEYTVATLGSNGILGIGTEPQDCDSQGINYCDNSTDAEAIINSQDGDEDPYWYCTNAGVCGQEVVPLANQLWNPVSAFSSTDTAGVLLTLQSIPAQGQSTVDGTLTFGINSQPNNTISSAEVYELDPDGNFATATFNGVNYTSANSYGAFIDSGSNALFVSDPTSLGISDCIISNTDIGYYCPSSTLSPSLTVTGANGTTSPLQTLSIENALDLFTANPSFAAYNDLGGPSCVPETNSPCTSETDYLDLGLPFFFGRPIYVGIAGGATYPNGYWAF